MQFWSAAGVFLKKWKAPPIGLSVSEPTAIVWPAVTYYLYRAGTHSHLLLASRLLASFR